MINDIIEIKLNGKTYRARLDMGAIAAAQFDVQKVKENMTVVEMFDSIKKENYKVINSLIIESIKRCHPQLTTEDILEDMKLKEKSVIMGQVAELIKASLPIDEDKKKEME
ncbi:hypothetical protein C672_1853 [[Clostridium] bifermentans ATCC 638]|uniref:Uncharacterized protein n=1 Tax=Paraclostridium bifermentans ATCC 638 = DSM 14991 TaxID=1233171 RepID=T4VGR5_PARBF|nr:hypothetical protein [Paraclostridium bifermentans]EQK42909.1 hypothetical protein C672_1853 [[Clostridium] bifermentans ATCC 638] [Paraclostridium bifermentans ATCC 638 = DSM 14991]RIZ58038.1 hypothetical protein CHH45_13395 [Paraclostridium bifermentans]UAG16793.1 hypothetical protein KXZ80_08305 [Paraclostridium bifermentans]